MMTLLELLVLELPKLGGWPEGVARLAQDPDGDIQMLSGRHTSYSCAGWYGDGRNDFSGQYAIRKHHTIAEDNATSIITREQYESALAASKPEWDGEGLPLVGVECQYETNGYGIKMVRVECVTMDGIAFTWLGDDPKFSGLDCINISQAHRFRPIRSEADKKRKDGVLALAFTDPHVAKFEYGERNINGELVGSAWYELYDKIAAGEVAGIRID